MNRRLWTFALATGVGLWAGCKAPPPATPKGGSQVQIVSTTRPDIDIVVFRLLFRTGSIDDPAERPGLTELAARVMAEGGTRKLGSADLLRALYPMAAELDVEVDKEQTVFQGRVHRDNVARFSQLLLDVVLEPRWDPKEFARIRDDMVHDITQRLRTSDDENLSKEALGTLLYEGHPYGHFSGGSVRGLGAATIEEAKAHAARVFGRARLVIGLGGGVPAALVPDFEARLAHLPQGLSPPAAPLAPARTPQTKLLLVEKESASSAFDMGYPWDLSRADPDWPAIVVAFSALGEHRESSGRLFRTLREARGLNYGDYAYPENFIQDGGKIARPNIARRQQHVSVWLRPVENKNRLFALRAALYELRRFANDGLTSEEVERTKKFLSGFTLLWDLTEAHRLGYALDEKFYGTPRYTASLREKIPQLTPAQVNEAIKRHFDPRRLAIVVVTKDAAAMRDAILAGKPTPIEYPTPKPKEILDEDKVIQELPWGIKPEEIKVIKAEDLFS